MCAKRLYLNIQIAREQSRMIDNNSIHQLIYDIEFPLILSLDKMEKYSQERRNLLDEVDKRLYSVENKMRVLEKLSDSSPVIANDIILLKTLVNELRSTTDNDLKKIQTWTEQQLSKIERRMDSLLDSRPFKGK